MKPELLEKLVKCLIDVFYALKSLEEDGLENLCVSLQEQAAADLQTLSTPDKELFLQLIRSLSEESSPEFKEFLLKFSEFIGLEA